MVNLREIAAKKLAEKMLGECEEEYRQMWHNASFRGDWPEYSDAESEYFWQWLGDEISCMIQMMQQEIKENHGLDLEIYQWGRSAATIAPDHFSYNGNGNHFNNTLDTRLIYDVDDLPTLEDGDDEGLATWVDAYQSVKAHLEAFQFINKRVRESAAHVATFWQEHKKNNPEIFEDLAEEDQEEDQAAG
jgi:hypothetical protein